MARKILVAEALDERDLLAKKITDKIGKISFVDVIRPNEENVFNLRQEKEKYIAKVKSSYQQLQDMITLFQKLDEAILVSNANTVIRTERGDMTVARAILLRSRMKEKEWVSDIRKEDFEMQFLDELEQQYTSAVLSAKQENENLQRKADMMRQQMEGNLTAPAAENKNTEDLIKQYVHENSVRVVDPLDLKNRLEEMRKQQKKLLKELDMKIKVSNALTYVEV